MKRCPKCKALNHPQATECQSCAVIFADIRNSIGEAIDRFCPFDDHGQRCGLYGTNSDTTNGQGPWYCSGHYWQLKGHISA